MEEVIIGGGDLSRIGWLDGPGPRHDVRGHSTMVLLLLLLLLEAIL